MLLDRYEHAPDSAGSSSVSKATESHTMMPITLKHHKQGMET